MDEIILITRTSEEEQQACYRFIERTIQYKLITKVIIGVFGKKDHVPNEPRIKVIEMKSNGPSTVLNMLFKEVPANFQGGILVVSKEVQIRLDELQRMVQRFEGEEDKLLAVGYRLQEIQKGSKPGEGIPSSQEEDVAFDVPWNTCILWNASLFRAKVKKFDTICDGGMGSLVLENFNPPLVTEFSGVEDGLALAKVAFEQSEGYYAVLFSESLPWVIPNEPERICDHRKKMARKSIVMRAFISARGYSEEKLRNFVKVE